MVKKRFKKNVYLLKILPITLQEDIILELGNRKYYIAPGIMFVLYNIQ